MWNKRFISIRFVNKFRLLNNYLGVPTTIEHQIYYIII